MTNKQAGWFLGLAALGMMFGLMAVDIANLDSWAQAAKPSFVGLQMAHISVVVAAFVGGKLVPTEPRDQRVTDIQIADVEKR